MSLSPAQIVHEFMRGLARTVPYLIGQDQLASALNCRPRPHVARTTRGGLGARDVLLLGVAESPNLVALDALGGHIAHRLIVVRGACFTRLDHQLGNGVYRDLGNAAGPAHGHALD